MDTEEAKRQGLIPYKEHPEPTYRPGGSPLSPFHGPDHLAPTLFRTQSEKDTWYSVVVEDEYDAPQKFEPEDIIIDIGAHIGSFSWLAHYRGSHSIYAFEIDPWHVNAAAVNLGEIIKAGYCELYHAAVVRSDAYRAKEYHYDGAWNSFGQLGMPVQSYSLDQIIEGADAPIRLIKTDCEGGEWPILYTCTMLDKVQEIVGEYHEMDASTPELQNLPYPLTRGALKIFLEDNGFKVELKAKGTLGNFHARRQPSHIKSTTTFYLPPSVASARISTSEDMPVAVAPLSVSSESPRSDSLKGETWNTEAEPVTATSSASISQRLRQLADELETYGK